MERQSHLLTPLEIEHEPVCFNVNLSLEVTSSFQEDRAHMMGRFTEWIGTLEGCVQVCVGVDAVPGGERGRGPVAQQL